MSFVIVSLGL